MLNPPQPANVRNRKHIYPVNVFVQRAVLASIGRLAPAVTICGATPAASGHYPQLYEIMSKPF